jgi:hypothetical protein
LTCRRIDPVQLDPLPNTSVAGDDSKAQRNLGAKSWATGASSKIL